MKTVTLKINNCGDCPHHKIGPTYSLDGWDRGEDWTCEKVGKQIEAFVERASPSIPSWCPLSEMKSKKSDEKKKMLSKSVRAKKPRASAKIRN